jgi:hypothetical protein
MNLTERIISAVSSAIASVMQAEVKGVSVPARRSLTLNALMEQVWQVMQVTDHGWMSDLFIDDAGQLYAIFQREGRTYRASVTINGTDVTLGALEEVAINYAPVSRSSITLRELPNGNVQIVMAAGTAVVNRVGEIDSTTLYDNMIDHAEELGDYPRIDFYHLGALHPLFEFGEVTMLARSGVTYIAAGELDGSNPLTQAFLTRYRENPEHWGCSIEYYPLRSPEVIRAGELDIEVYRDGINTRISILPEDSAAAWFTSLTLGGENMKRELDEKKKAALRELLGGDENLNQFLAQLDGVDRAAEGMISREGEQGATLIPTIELDEDTVEALANRIAEIIATKHDLAQINGQVETLVTGAADTQRSVDALTKSVAELQQRMAAISRDEGEKKKEWLGDLPVKKVALSFRQSQSRQAQPVGSTDSPTDEEQEFDLAGQASRVLSGLHRGGK